MDHPAALHRIKVGVPATVEHSSEAGPETGKWVAETTQVRSLQRSSFFSNSCIIQLHYSPGLLARSCLHVFVFVTIQSFITFMDALKLRMRAKDQLHPILQELMTNYARFKASKDWEGRSRMVSWYVCHHSTHFSRQNVCPPPPRDRKQFNRSLYHVYLF